MFNPIEEKRRLVQERIAKSFDSGINVTDEIEFEKAHKDGDHHPTKPWVWVASANGGKGDWRVEGGRSHKKAGASQTQSSISDLASKIKSNIEAVLKVAGVKSYIDVVDVKATDTSVIIKYNDSGQHTHTLPLTKSVALNVLKLAENHQIAENHQKNTPAARKPGSTDEIERMTPTAVYNAILGLNNIGTKVKDRGDHFLIEFDANDFTTHGQRSPQIDRIAKYLESMGASCVIGKNNIKAYKKVESKKDSTQTTKKRYNLNPDGTPMDLSKMEDDNLRFSIALVKTNIRDLKNKLAQTSNGAVVTRKNLNAQIEDQEGKLAEMEEEINKRANSKSTTNKTQSPQDKVKDVMQQFDDTTMDEDEFDEYVDSILGNDMGQKLRKQILESNKSFSDKKQAYKDAVEKHLGLKPQKYYDMDIKDAKKALVGKVVTLRYYWPDGYGGNLDAVGEIKNVRLYGKDKLPIAEISYPNGDKQMIRLDEIDDGKMKDSYKTPIVVGDDKTRLDAIKKKIANINSDSRDVIAQTAGFKDYEEMKGYQDYVTQKNLLKKKSTKSGMRLLYEKEVAKYEKDHADLLASLANGKK